MSGELRFEGPCPTRWLAEFDQRRAAVRDGRCPRCDRDLEPFGAVELVCLPCELVFEVSETSFVERVLS